MLSSVALIYHSRGGAGTANDGDTDNGNFTVETPEEVQGKRNAGGAALYGETDIDLGPSLTNLETYNDETSDNGKAEHTAPVPNENAKSAILRYQPFVSWCNSWVIDARAAKYAKEHSDGEQAQANMHHVLARVGKLGYTEVTADNAEAIKRDLQKYIEQQA